MEYRCYTGDEWNSVHALDQIYENYEILVGPGEFRVFLTEPEDRIWSRDLKDVIDRLNDQHAELIRLRRDSEALGRVREQLEHSRKILHQYKGMDGWSAAESVIEDCLDAIADAGEGES